ncbi:MAG: spore coat protein [Treponema sp.]|nr:spore coat protein [Treponema sp.]
MTAVVLQARLDSSRLPQKAMLCIDGKPLVLHVMNALKEIFANIHVLACPDDSFGVFKPLAEEAGFKIVSGPKEDVLERFCIVIREFKIDRIIRATGDNPFVFTDAASLLNEEAVKLNCDYAGFSELPYGAGVESVSASALLKAANETELPFDREHVCPYLYNNPQVFKLHRPSAPSQWKYPQIRLTVDTQEDFDKAKILYNALKNNPNRYNGTTIIEVFKKLF